MKYRNVLEARFIARPNRFIARVMLEGREETVHIKNTGRCAELLVPGATVWLEESDNPDRKTRFSLVTVQKGEMLVNIDSQAPNALLAEWLAAGGVLPGLPDPVTQICREVKLGESRIDFLLTAGGQPVYIEVKGATLEQGGGAYFPDAPTLRGVRHIEELIHHRQQGLPACILFVVQMKGVSLLSPNDRTHPEFGRALRLAAQSGVQVLAYDCRVTPNEILLDSPVEVKL